MSVALAWQRHTIMKQIILLIAVTAILARAAAAQLPPNIKIANDQPRANLGAKINAADAACGASVGCQIWVFDGGSVEANTISSQIVVGSNHTLKFFEGIFYCRFPSQSGVILLKDNSNLTGAGWNTVIVENSDPLVQTYNPATGLGTETRTASYRIVAPFNTQFSCSSGSTNDRKKHISRTRKAPVHNRVCDESGGAPIVVTLTEAHHIPGGGRIRLRGVTPTGGAPAFNPDQDYCIKPLTPTSFSLVKADINTGTEKNPVYLTPQNGTGTGTYTVNPDSKIDCRGIFIVGLDVEPNGSFYERVNNVQIVNNLFDFRRINGVAAAAIAH